MKALFQIDPDVGLIILSAGPLNTDGHPSGLSKNIRLLSKQQAKPEQVVREAKRLLHGQGPLI
jgi:hypothetical protein